MCGRTGRGFGRGAGFGRGDQRGLDPGRAETRGEKSALERLATMLDRRLRQFDQPAAEPGGGGPSSK